MIVVVVLSDGPDREPDVGPWRQEDAAAPELERFVVIISVIASSRALFCSSWPSSSATTGSTPCSSSSRCSWPTCPRASSRRSLSVRTPLQRILFKSTSILFSITQQPMIHRGQNKLCKKVASLASMMSSIE